MPLGDAAWRRLDAEIDDPVGRDCRETSGTYAALQAGARAAALAILIETKSALSGVLVSPTAMRAGGHNEPLTALMVLADPDKLRS
jgi:hypothetical protein